MSELNFRALRADEVDVRVAEVKETKNGVRISLLLYKDARCDMNVLDETVGAMNWKREHSRDNANCTVSLWDEEKKQWIGKEDTGTESNTEAEKGLASDSFKRACFNWGIGRELYTGPSIYIYATGKDGAENFTVSENPKTKKPTTYDKFKVTYMKVVDGRITGLNIENTRKRRSVFSWGDLIPESPDASPLPNWKKEMEEAHPQGSERGALKCSICGKPVNDAWARKSIEKYGAIYCGEQCLNERPIE